MAYYEDIVTDENYKTKCELCKTFLNDNDSEIEQHINDKDHTVLFMKRLMIQNGVVINAKQVTCGACAKTLEVTEIINHIQSTPHATMLASIKETILKDGGLLIMPEQINEGSEVNCLVCDRRMVLNLNVIKSHIDTTIHRRARSIAVQPLNAIFSVDGCKGDLWCKICKVYFENYVETILEHVDEDRNHVTVMKKLLLLIKNQSISIEKFLYDPDPNVKAFCSKCDIEVPCNLDNLERHIKGKKHTS